MKKYCFIIFLIFSIRANGQNEDIDLEEFAQQLFQFQDDNTSLEDVYESLLLYYSNKLNLNRVEPEELGSLYILNPVQLNNFFDYRDRFGDFLSLNELQVIPEMDLVTIQMLKPFVTIDEPRTDARSLVKRILTEDNNYFLLRLSRRLEKQVGYTDAFPLDTTFIRSENNRIIDTLTTAPSRYVGSPYKIYGRFRTSHKNDFSLGFTFEKDQGEKISMTNGRKGFDFYSYHLLLENKFGFKKIALGDFQLQVGQGLVYGAGFNPGKGSETVNTVKRNSIGIRPYTSVLETGFFRGLGITRQIRDFEFTLFISALRQDGVLKTDTSYSDFPEHISSIQTSGLHRTKTELSSINQLLENSIGAIVRYSPNRRFNVGLTMLNTKWSKPLQRKPNGYNQFEFSGNYNMIGSLFAHYTWQNFTFFGEAAHSKSGGSGSIGGLVASLSSTVDAAMVFRKFERNFHSFYAQAFSENSRPINEIGTYWGIAIKPSREHKISAYYDRFRFPWLKFGVESPSSGYEWLIRYTFSPSRQITSYFQIGQQLRQVSTSNENLNRLVNQIRRNFIFNLDYKLTAKVKLKTRIQSSLQKEAQNITKGFAIIQDVNIDIWKLKVSSRLALFETDDFDNAQYVYERDVLYAFSIPAYNGTGSRTYFMVRFDPTKKISIWIRYAQTIFNQQVGSDRTIGSSLETSFGDKASELKCMFRVKF